MEAEDCVEHVREGRRNRYTVNLLAVRKMQTQLPYNVEQIVRAIARLFFDEQRPT
jgi:hypothetical protein